MFKSPRADLVQIQPTTPISFFNLNLSAKFQLRKNRVNRFDGLSYLVNRCWRWNTSLSFLKHLTVITKQIVNRNQITIIEIPRGVLLRRCAPKNGKSIH